MLGRSQCWNGCSLTLQYNFTMKTIRLCTFEWPLTDWLIESSFTAGMHRVLAQGRGEYGWRSLQGHKFDRGVFTWELHHQGFLAAIHSGDGILYTYWIVRILNSPLIEQNNYWTVHSLNNMHIEQSTYWKYWTIHLLKNTHIEQCTYRTILVPSECIGL